MISENNENKESTYSLYIYSLVSNRQGDWNSWGGGLEKISKINSQGGWNNRGGLEKISEINSRGGLEQISLVFLGKTK